MAERTRTSTRDVVAFLKERDIDCPRCDRNLRGADSPACPACGRTWSVARLRAADYMQNRFWWQLGFAGGVFGLVVLLVCLVDATDGRIALAPERFFPPLPPRPLTLATLVATGVQLVALLSWAAGAGWVRRNRSVSWSLAIALWWPVFALAATWALIITAAKLSPL